jgi:hypothetical protein
MATKTKPAPETFDAFANAEVVPTATVAPKGKKAARPEFEVKGLTNLAACRAIIATLKGAEETFKAPIDKRIFDVYVDRAFATKSVPVNFTGIDEIKNKDGKTTMASASASCEVKKRSTASPLSEDEQKELRNLKIPFTEETVVPAIPERYFIDEELVQDPDVRAAISAALASSPKLKGLTLIKKQAPTEAVTKMVVTDESVIAACQLQNRDQMERALKIVVGTAVKTVFEQEDVKIALDVLAAAGIKLKK